MGVPPSTDEQLIRQLYDEHAGMLLGYVRRLVNGDTARAEDVVQETLLRAWQHPGSVESNGSDGARARAWLLTVARHLVVDGERARRSRPLEVATVDPVAEGRAPAVRFDERGFDRVLLEQEVSAALGTLSGDHRAVIDQLYFRDRTVPEAAQVLGVPEGTVKSRAYYALRALRAACTQRGVLP